MKPFGVILLLSVISISLFSCKKDTQIECPEEVLTEKFVPEFTESKILNYFEKRTSNFSLTLPNVYLAIIER